MEKNPMDVSPNLATTSFLVLLSDRLAVSFNFFFKPLPKRVFRNRRQKNSCLSVRKHHCVITKPSVNVCVFPYCDRRQGTHRWHNNTQGANCHCWYFSLLLSPATSCFGIFIWWFKFVYPEKNGTFCATK